MGKHPTSDASLAEMMESTTLTPQEQAELEQVNAMAGSIAALADQFQAFSDAQFDSKIRDVTDETAALQEQMNATDNEQEKARIKERIDGLNKEIINLADEASKMQGDIEAFKPDREKLGRALSAASLDGAYATLTATRKQQADDSAGLKAEEEALPGLESSAKEQAEALKSAEQQTAQAKEELKAATPTLQKVRSLDQKHADQKKSARPAHHT